MRSLARTCVFNRFSHSDVTAARRFSCSAMAVRSRSSRSEIWACKQREGGSQHV